MLEHRYESQNVSIKPGELHFSSGTRAPKLKPKQRMEKAKLSRHQTLQSSRHLNDYFG